MKIMAAVTPLMRQYFELKERTSDCILFFRLGDFYEMFGEDAKTASRELEITLTSRDRSTENPDERMPMCGVPYHSSEAYIARLIAKGYKVAICEQMEDPSLAKGLVDRDVVRIVTPGTLMESSMLKEDRPNYLAAVHAGDTLAACFADLSTGEISFTEFPDGDIKKLQNELSSFSPAEAILNAEAFNIPGLSPFLSERLHCLTDCRSDLFDGADAEARISAQFGDNTAKDYFMCAGAVSAVGALLAYLADTQKTDISHFRVLKKNFRDSYMELDIQTLKNLELVTTLRTGEKKGSLLWVLDKTKTPMGRRLIRSWALRPLLQPSEIIRRLNAVNELVSGTVARGELIHALRAVGDMERLIGKIVYGTAGSRDMKALSSSIAMLPEITGQLSGMKSALLSEVRELDPLSDVALLIDGTIDENPPFSIREGGFIKSGVSEEVDRLRGLLRNSSGALTDIEAREKERTGKKLKIGYNKVFGYYIEIPRSSSEDVPGDYVRKQTLANCERFITQELKELETELLTAKDKLSALEYSLFNELRERVAAEVGRVQESALRVAVIDTLCSFAETAVKNGYCMPEINVSGVIDIQEGRHPVVEKMQEGALFVPNDTYLDCDGSKTAIITGPNMAGKSTYMRQTALIVLMAQMGSFVPARRAGIGIVDRVFTRIGASDDLSAGMSTFMVEMTEVAEILQHATKNSLLILDEIGRGTSTYDGMAVARAVLEHCADKKKLGAKTLFATHYHELTSLEAELPGVINLSISAKKRGDDIIFLRKIVSGAADDSYGIEVAGLAGIPETVIKRAKAILRLLEDSGGPKAAKAPESEKPQMTLLDVGGGEIAAMIKDIDLNTITPLEALNLLFELKKKVRET